MGVGFADSGDQNLEGFIDAVTSLDMIFGTSVPLELDSELAVVDWLEWDLLAWASTSMLPTS